MGGQPSGGGFQVVTPGSADDPFSAQNSQGAQDGSGQDGAGDQGGAAGDQSQSQQNAQGAQGTQGSSPQGAQGEGEGSGDEGGEGSPPEFETLFRERLDAELPKIQSGWDRQNKALRAENENLQKQIAETNRLVREGQLSQLSPEDQSKMRAQWDNEDAQKQIDEKLKATDEYYFATHAYSILTRFSQFGVTEDELLACETTDDMDRLALETKASFFEAKSEGKDPLAKKNGAKSSSKPPARSPAAARMGSDMGGVGASKSGSDQGILTDQGLDAMSANVKSLFSKPGSVV